MSLSPTKYTSEIVIFKVQVERPKPKTNPSHQVAYFSYPQSQIYVLLL